MAVVTPLPLLGPSLTSTRCGRRLRGLHRRRGPRAGLGRSAAPPRSEATCPVRRARVARRRADGHAHRGCSCSASTGGRAAGRAALGGLDTHGRPDRRLVEAVDGDQARARLEIRPYAEAETIRARPVGGWCPTSAATCGPARCSRRSCARDRRRVAERSPRPRHPHAGRTWRSTWAPGAASRHCTSAQHAQRRHRDRHQRSRAADGRDHRRPVRCRSGTCGGDRCWRRSPGRRST